MIGKHLNNSLGVILADFVSVKPSSPISQEIACDILATAIAKAKCIEHNITDQQEIDAQLNHARIKVAQYGISSKYIKQRYMVLAASDFSNKFTIGKKITENGKFTEILLNSQLFREITINHRSPQGLDIEQRMVLFDKFAGKCIHQMYEGVEIPPDDVIHVTCSGYLSPSPVERFFSEKQWLNTTITHSYHMGCYGSIPALRMAHGFLCSARYGITPPKHRVDIIHTEILSAHSKIVDDSAEQIITMTLFGDGFIKYSAYTEEYCNGKNIHGLKILLIKEHLIKNSLESMTWNLGQHNFNMTLALSVPYAIRDMIKAYVYQMFADLGLDFMLEKQQGNIVFAIHPGGPLIVKKICDELDLSEEDVAFSTKVLYENGNMSSATIPYILAEIINDKTIPPGKKILSMAFGPGLTIAGMILEKV
ncbi:MAG: type III polyketide synthase [Chlorobium sp.]|nr:MAG: type III polyketide synthase [Chlorobium sp.]